MKIAIAQTDIKFEEKIYNWEKAKEIVREAKNNKAELVAFPEMSFTGFSMNISETSEKNCETLEFMKKCALENGIAIAAGWVNKCKDKAENHYSVVDKAGKIISDYVKIHPFTYGGEDEFFIAGDKITNVDFMGRKICTFICYDLRFPEIFRRVVDEADIIIIPANWPATRDTHWRSLLQARAIENQCYIVGVNCVGNQQNIHYCGSSCVINPNGVFLQIASEHESLFLVDIRDDVDKYREEFPVLKDRKNWV
ncbi:carbon-nitrogen family hydrolase [Clostridium sp. DL1XJH146]